MNTTTRRPQSLPVQLDAVDEFMASAFAGRTNFAQLLAMTVIAEAHAHKFAADFAKEIQS
jgi:hypothetical protein